DIAKVAHDSVVPFRQHDTMNAPLIAFGNAAIATWLDALRCCVRVSCFECMAELTYDLIGVLFRPQGMDDLIEISANQLGNVAKDGARDGIDFQDPKIRIDQVYPQRGLIQKCLKLFSATTQRLLTPAAQSRQLEQTAHAGH